MDDFDEQEEGWFLTLFATLRDEAHDVADDLGPIMNRIRSSQMGRYTHPTLDGMLSRILFGIFGPGRDDND